MTVLHPLLGSCGARAISFAGETPASNIRIAYRSIGHGCAFLTATLMRMARAETLATSFGHRQGLKFSRSVRYKAIYENLETTFTAIRSG
jgi:hypothetical protein